MNRQQFEQTCELVRSGERRYVRDQKSLYTGEILSCDNGKFRVDVFGHRTEWEMGRCEVDEKFVNPLGPPTNT